MIDALIAFGIGGAVLAVTIVTVILGTHYVADKIVEEDEDERSRRQRLKEDYPEIFGNTPDR